MSPRGRGGRWPFAASRGELERELRHHLEECVDLLMEQGWNREEAVGEAERRFGDLDGIRDELADVQREGSAGGRDGLRSAGYDLRHALRGLLARPLFSVSVVVTVGLGVGAAAAMFAVTDAAVLRALPYREGARLLEVKHREGYAGVGTLPAELVSEFLDGVRPFTDGWLAFRSGQADVRRGRAAERLWFVGVTPGADTLLGIPLRMGRSLTPEDARPGSPDVVVLTAEYFARHGADPALLGATLLVDRRPATIVGVLGESVRLPQYGEPAAFWVPLRTDFTMLSAPRPVAQELWIRLAPDVDRGAARERVAALGRGFQEQGRVPPQWSVNVRRVGEIRLDAGTERALLATAATSLAILLIAVVNGVNLQLVRSSARVRELQVRLALGASRMRLLRQLMVEGSVLGMAGGLVAVALAWLALTGLRGIFPSLLVASSPFPFEVEGRTLAVTFAASILVGLTLGLLPALCVVRSRGLAPGLRRHGDDRRAAFTRSALVVAQVAVSMTLLVSAGLFVRSLARLWSVDPGFAAERLVTARIELPPDRYPQPADRLDFLRRLEEGLEARPEVVGVSASAPSMLGSPFRDPLQAEGRDPPPGQPFVLPAHRVRPDFIDVMGIELVAGRGFLDRDAGTTAVVVDRDLARFLWGDEDPVGRRFRLGEGDWHTVVGVALDPRLFGRDQRQRPYHVLVAADATDTPMQANFPLTDLHVRAGGEPAPLLPVVREVLAALDPDVTVRYLDTAMRGLALAEEQPRFLTAVMVLFAGVAVSLAAVGLFGVLAYTVSLRQRELAVRAALGADPRRLRHRVLRLGLGMAAVGVFAGIGGSWLATRSLAAFFYEVEAGDPGTLLATATLFLLIATAASLLPARRATRVDPVVVLRAE